MKKLLIILILIISTTCFPLYNNDYVDITHMVNAESIGIDYIDGEFTIYTYVINNYTMSKSDYNTSSPSSAATVITAKADQLDKAFFQLNDSTFVTLNYSHIESIVLHKNFMNSENINTFINFISTHRDFYPKFNIYITDEDLSKIYNINYFNDTSSYYSILTEYKSSIEHHHTSFIDFINDFVEQNYFILYPSIKLIDNISKDNKTGKSLYIDGYYYYDNGILKHLSYKNESKLYLLYSTNDILFDVNKQYYQLKSYSIKTIRFSNHLYILFYAKSTYEHSLKELLYDYLIYLYQNDIDVYNLKYFNISVEHIKIISVEKIQKKL